MVLVRSNSIGERDCPQPELVGVLAWHEISLPSKPDLNRDTGNDPSGRSACQPNRQQPPTTFVRHATAKKIIAKVKLQFAGPDSDGDGGDVVLDPAHLASGSRTNTLPRS